MNLNKWLLILLLGLTGKVAAQSRESVFELNKKLERGINMGSMFEAPSENEWGNPYRANYFQRIASLGFQHVRIPIRWDTPARTQMTPPYTVSPAFLARIQEVVDEAHRQGLYAIINMHHHEEIFYRPRRSGAAFPGAVAANCRAFQGLRRKIAFRGNERAPRRAYARTLEQVLCRSARRNQKDQPHSRRADGCSALRQRERGSAAGTARRPVHYRIAPLLQSVSFYAPGSRLGGGRGKQVAWDGMAGLRLRTAGSGAGICTRHCFFAKKQSARPRR